LLLGGPADLMSQADAMGRLDDDVFITEQDRALAAARLLKAGAKLRQILVRINHVSFDRLIGAAIVSAIIERDPLSAVLPGSCCIRPAWLTATHSLLTSPPRGCL